jgi:hypothetical protein
MMNKDQKRRGNHVLSDNLETPRGVPERRGSHDDVVEERQRFYVDLGSLF